MNDETLAALELAADAVMGYERTSVAERVKASFAIRAHIADLRNGGERAKVVAWLRKLVVGGDNWQSVNDTHADAADAIEAGAHMGGDDER